MSSVFNFLVCVDCFSHSASPITALNNSAKPFMVEELLVSNSPMITVHMAMCM